MDSYEMDDRYLTLSRQFADLCGEQSNIERALNNGIPDCDKTQLKARLIAVNRGLVRKQQQLGG